METIRELYARRAKRYNFTSNLYYLMGVRMAAYRREAVKALRLRPGSRILDVGCGTGLNFPYLRRAVGENGTILGLDFTPAMLAQARARVRSHGWENVELIEGDATRFELKQKVDGVLSTFAVSTIPTYPEMVRRSAAVLAPGGRLVILDVKFSRLELLNRLVVPLTRPFGGNPDVLARKPWETMRKELAEVGLREYFLGYLYIASGVKR